MRSARGAAARTFHAGGRPRGERGMHTLAVRHVPCGCTLKTRAAAWRVCAPRCPVSNNIEKSKPVKSEQQQKAPACRIPIHIALRRNGSKRILHAHPPTPLRPALGPLLTLHTGSSSRRRNHFPGCTLAVSPSPRASAGEAPLKDLNHVINHVASAR